MIWCFSYNYSHELEHVRFSKIWSSKNVPNFAVTLYQIYFIQRTFLLKLVFQSFFLSFLCYLLLFSFKKTFFLFFSDHSVYVAYLGFHTLLFFEHQVFLLLDVFSYYNKDTQRNRNKVIIRRNIIFCFSCLSVLEVNNTILVESVVSTVKKPNHSS